VPGIPPLAVAPAVVVIVVVGAPPAAALALLSLVPIAPALAVVLTPGSSPALEPLPGGIGSSPDPPQAARGSKSEHTRDPTPMRERSVIDSRTPATGFNGSPFSAEPKVWVRSGGAVERTVGRCTLGNPLASPGTVSSRAGRRVHPKRGSC